MAHIYSRRLQRDPHYTSQQFVLTITYYGEHALIFSTYGHPHYVREEESEPLEKEKDKGL